MVLPEKVTLIEVGPRDGLQNEKNVIPTDVKIAFIEALKAAGLREMELASFVSPKWVPQMKDAEAVIAACLDPEARHFILAPNQKGVERFYATGADHIALFIGVSSAFNKKNINKTTEESWAEAAPLIEKLKADGKFVRICISTAFHCPYEGQVEKAATIDLCRRFAALGVDELSVADTTGMANPQDAYELFGALKALLPKRLLLTAHFHNTRGLALANIYACLLAGIDRFDASAGGLGGCPFAPGATGNVATEDVVFMFHEMGIETGVSIDRLLDAADLIQPYVSRPLDSKQYALYRRAK
ncbi:hydroxymethylglutaryl-CoA lyase [Caenibacillus caldisaponilyticus]|uniref:hydroxymethylglutaryl-CoA lyase n=1 Tax=Caenibacillus caldisaponilyticus TaxID=1674942 RepID=UPI0009884D4D|nr:hydroxymethylglutaryl-CoA lyase [Caenibacillus caldisaponilyticus]